MNDRFSLVLRLSRALKGAFLAVFLATGLVMGGTGWASPLAFADAEVPAFTEALAVWLADDEATALPALAALATGGNRAARLLLGLIDKTPALQGPFLARAARADRIALLRAPGGISGRNWLNTLEDEPLGTAWLALQHPGSGPEVVAAFSALGETRAARVAMVLLAARAHAALREVALPEADHEMLYVLWRAADEARRGEIAARVPRDHPQRRLMGETPDARDLDRWLRQNEAAAPLAALCDAVCPADTAPCLSAGYRALGSHDALMTLGTPAETLVAQDSFLASPRGRASVLRRILLASTMRARRAMLARVDAQSACLGEALSAEAERARPARPVIQPSAPVQVPDGG